MGRFGIDIQICQGFLGEPVETNLICYYKKKKNLTRLPVVRKPVPRLTIGLKSGVEADTLNDCLLQFAELIAFSPIHPTKPPPPHKKKDLGQLGTSLGVIEVPDA